MNFPLLPGPLTSLIVSTIPHSMAAVIKGSAAAATRRRCMTSSDAEETSGSNCHLHGGRTLSNVDVADIAAIVTPGLIVGRTLWGDDLDDVVDNVELRAIRTNPSDSHLGAILVETCRTAAKDAIKEKEERQPTAAEHALAVANMLLHILSSMTPTAAPVERHETMSPARLRLEITLHKRTRSIWRLDNSVVRRRVAAVTKVAKATCAHSIQVGVVLIG